MAPPSKLTLELQAKICEYIKAGNYPEAAAVAAGISRRTIRRWMERGEQSRRGPYHDLVLAMARARAIAQVANAAVISRAAKSGDWRASAFLLERTDPENWGKRDRVDVKADVRHRGGIEFRPFDKMVLPEEEPDPTAPKAKIDDPAPASKASDPIVPPAGDP